jgi:spore photoproduct lyase
MCLFCYLVLQLQQVLLSARFRQPRADDGRLVKTSRKSDRPLTFEIGSNSDLVLENAVTDNLPWTIETFAEQGRGHITFPTKFDTVEPLLGLEHKEKTIFRMSVNPDEVIRRVEYGTSPLSGRMRALNRMHEAGYQTGLLIAPVILQDDWRTLYGGCLSSLPTDS